ncbi:MAG: hypothetical protein LVQ96_07150 [Thermoplasmatales archaeon]|nr:hypothetical protein [Thermoplasmatales archaeon]MCW6170932.1 hypothetical protein [Thermoplasmatales archaeon]
MSVLTRDVLIKALENTYGQKGMVTGDIEELCDFILSFFGYEDYVLDNVLSAPERDVFYNLEEYGFLETHREEVNIVKGRSWRINQWVYNKENIYNASKPKNVPEIQGDIYEQIFKEIENNET